MHLFFIHSQSHSVISPIFTYNLNYQRKRNLRFCKMQITSRILIKKLLPTSPLRFGPWLSKVSASVGAFRPNSSFLELKNKEKWSLEAALIRIKRIFEKDKAIYCIRHCFSFLCSADLKIPHLDWSDTLKEEKKKAEKRMNLVRRSEWHFPQSPAVP